eukprot:8017841-Lingulodinium_polyedra.AAC.1
MGRKATWPTLSARGCQTLPPETALLSLCQRGDNFELASGSWKAGFLRAGSVLKQASTGRWVLCCGDVSPLAVVVWHLEEVSLRPGVALLQPRTTGSDLWDF